MGRLFAGHYVSDEEFATIQEALKSEPDPRDSSDAAQERAKVINKAEGIIPTEDAELEKLAEARAAGFPSIEAQAEVASIVENAPVGEPNPPSSVSNADVVDATEAAKAEAARVAQDKADAEAADAAAKAADAQVAQDAQA